MYTITQERDCDFCVIGSGTGLIAAARAALAGYKVVVLEKANQVGGGTRFASTMRTFGSQWQKKRGLPDVTAEYARKQLDGCFWRIDPKLVENVLKATGEFFDWFLDYAQIPEDLFTVGRYVFDDEETGPLGPQYGVQHNGFGRMVVENLEKKCRELGVDILLGHRAVDVIVEDGRIRAYIAETENGCVRVNCRASLMACGSFISNRAETEKILPDFFEVDMGPSPHTNPNYTGDGIALGEKVGALVDRDSFVIRFMGPFHFTKNRTYSAMTTNPYSISVNLLGKRWTSEPLIAHMDQFDGGAVLAPQPKGRVFVVFSDNALAEAIRQGDGSLFIPDAIMRGQPLPESLEEAHADIQAAMDEGLTNCFRGETIEELAAAAGIDPAGLRETIEDYNRGCEEGIDWGFFKPKSSLVPFSQGPYYAISGFLATDGAFGGIKVNPDMQAYAADGGLVEGLWCCGDFASGRHISLLGGTVKRQFINDCNWAFAGSYIAGDRVVKYLDRL